MRALAVGAIALALGTVAGCALLVGVGELTPNTSDGSAEAAPPASDATDLDARDLDASTLEGSTCVPVATMATAPSDISTCIPTDASCQPRAVDASSLQWVRPPPLQNVCTGSLLAQYAQECGPPSTASCSSFETSQPLCYKCLFSTAGDSTYGVAVQYATKLGALDFLNTGGCVAALEPCNLPCATAIVELSACQFAACSQCGAADLGACAIQAETCPCHEYSMAASACLNEITARKSSAARCVVNEMTLATNVEALGAVMCGGGADGG